MKIAIIYDSVFGNTAEVARHIAEALRGSHEVTLAGIGEAGGLDESSFDLLVIGSPTRGFRPTPAMSEYLSGLPEGADRAAATFDTRIDLQTIHPAPLRWVVEAGGYAGDRIAGKLREKGYALRGTAGGFLVTATEGPLAAGEAERAAAWAAELVG